VIASLMLGKEYGQAGGVLPTLILQKFFPKLRLKKQC
jgi:hypothetical protein